MRDIPPEYLGFIAKTATICSFPVLNLPSHDLRMHAAHRPARDEHSYHMDSLPGLEKNFDYRVYCKLK